MTNEFVDLGSVAIIYLRRRDGEFFQTTISRHRLARAQDFPGTWCLLEVPRKGHSHYYAVGKIYDERHSRPGGGGGKNAYLHRWILGLTASRPWVNHIDWNGLNNVDENLEITTPTKNRQHRRLGAHLVARNTSGLRNVRRTRTGWMVQVAGQHVGTFKTKKDANRAAAQARARITMERLKKAIKRTGSTEPEN